MVLANAVGASGTLGFAGVLALGGGLRSSLVVLPFLALAAAAVSAGCAVAVALRRPA